MCALLHHNDPSEKMSVSQQSANSCNDKKKCNPTRKQKYSGSQSQLSRLTNFYFSMSNQRGYI